MHAHNTRTHTRTHPLQGVGNAVRDRRDDCITADAGSRGGAYVHTHPCVATRISASPAHICAPAHTHILHAHKHDAPTLTIHPHSRTDCARAHAQVVDDVVLGFDGAEEYLKPGPYFGCIAGRVANRIKDGEFVLGEGRTEAHPHARAHTYMRPHARARVRKHTHTHTHTHTKGMTKGPIRWRRTTGPTASMVATSGFRCVRGQRRPAPDRGRSRSGS